VALTRPIPEIGADEIGNVWERYVLTRTPVVIRGLLADRPLAAASTMESAVELLGHLPVVIQEEYSRSAGGQRVPAAPEVASLADYVARFGDIPDSGRVVTELDVPPAMLELFDVPDFCQPVAPTHDLFLHTFLAGRGNYAHLHFDQDQRHVLLIQVFGRKRVVLFPPSASRWLHPFGNLGSIRLQAMDDRTRDAFVECAGGMQTILEPTDAVFMPVLVWHYTDYLDTGMSFNIRFRRNEYNQFLSVDNFVGDRYVQAVAAPFSTVPPCGPLPDHLAENFAEITEVFDRDYASQLDKYRAVHGIFREICSRCGLDGDPLFLFPLDERTAIEAEQGMRNGFRYRPDGRRAADLLQPDAQPASASQVRMLTQRIDVLGYSDELLRKVLRNKFARTSLSELRRSEGARFLAYLNSPSALPRAPVAA